MTASLQQIQGILAEHGYDVTEVNEHLLKIREVESGVSLSAVLANDILFLSLTCITVPESAITPALMRKMLDADNGISTSHFQLYPVGPGKLAITLNNFCKLQDMGPEDEDDILSCVHFLLIDVIAARVVVGNIS